MMKSKRRPSALQMLKAKKIPKLDHKVRKHLPGDPLLDVFSCLDRHTLDDANIAFNSSNAAAQRAPPLRVVDDVDFTYTPEDNTFRVTISYEQKTLSKVANNVDEAVLVFFRCLRFCTVNDHIGIHSVCISLEFLDQLKAVSKDFRCRDENLEFTNVTLADGVHALDLLLSFPSFRTLNDSTYSFSTEHICDGDDLLKAVASRGAFSLLGKQKISFVEEERILDYVFGDYKDGGEVRKLIVNRPSLSKNMLHKLVKACRDCKGEIKIDLAISGIRDDLNMVELTKHIEKAFDEEGVSRPSGDRGDRWRIRFDDLSELNVEYTPRRRLGSSACWALGELRCWGTVRGSRST